MTNNASTAFRVAVHGDVATLAPVGQVFMKREAGEFRRVLEGCRRDGITHFVLDLSLCDYVSSEGLGVFADLWKKCQTRKDGRMAFVLSQKPGNEVTHLFEISGMTRVIGDAIRPDVRDAVEYLKAATQQ